jgi:hypothetical protein
MAKVTAEKINEVNQFKAKLQAAAEAKYGPVSWKSALAKDARWPVSALRTFLHRGKKMPSADIMDRVREVLTLGAAAATPGAAPKKSIYAVRRASRAEEQLRKAQKAARRLSQILK